MYNYDSCFVVPDSVIRLPEFRGGVTTTDALTAWDLSHSLGKSARGRDQAHSVLCHSVLSRNTGLVCFAHLTPEDLCVPRSLRLLSALCLLSSGQTTPVAPMPREKPSTYFPAVVGTKWVYEWTIDGRKEKDM